MQLAKIIIEVTLTGEPYGKHGHISINVEHHAKIEPGTPVQAIIDGIETDRIALLRDMAVEIAKRDHKVFNKPHS